MPQKRILIVEDDIDSQEMVTTILQHMNFIVDTADDGEQAIEMIRNVGLGYKAIVIDLALPEKDGFEVLNSVLDNPKTESIPCIAVTAFHNSKLREEALQAGFIAYFPKPIDGTQLGREIDSII
ncbi:MAG: response regulator [Phototrophicaceae bacterium]